MRIGWDIDGVLANETDAYLQRYVCPYLGMPLTAENVPESNYVNIHPSLTIPIIRELFGKANEEGMFEHLEPYPYIEVMRALRDDDHYAITHRHRKVIAQTYRWCMRQELPLKGVWFSDSFHTLGGVTKKELSEFLSIDAFIEDNVENAIAISEAVPHVYIVTRPWNRLQELPPHIKRVETPEELTNHLLSVRGYHRSS